MVMTMVKWYVVMAPVNGYRSAVTVEADEMKIDNGCLTLLQGGKIVAAITPGAWVSVEREHVSAEIST